MASVCSFYKQMGYPHRAKTYLTVGTSTLSSVALLVVGFVALIGAFQGTSVGWVTVGLASCAFACNLATGNLRERKFQLVTGALVALSMIIVGSLGGTGILSALQVGKGTLITLQFAFLIYGFNYLCRPTPPWLPPLPALQN